jgi:predicted esterase
MHGFGAPGDDLVRAADSIGALSPQTSFVVVEAPHHRALGRAWMTGGTLEQTNEQVAESRQRINDTLDDLVDQGVTPENIYIGGFSQGSQMALDMGFGEGSKHPVAGLILLSGGYPNWPGSPNPKDLGASNLAPTARAFVAHGNADKVLPLGGSKRLHQQLESRMPAEWVEFEGGHSVVPAEPAIAQFLNAH